MSGTAVRALGEIALRVNDLGAMTRFYRDVIGLDILGEFPSAVFFKVAEGFGGHTQVFVLFDRSVPVEPGHTTLDHIAFSIALEDYDSELKRLRALGLPVETTTHQWVKWRSIYVRDPEGNQIEFVCYDPAISG
ncbi:MAG TPA: VOC family protein [Chthoniobacterales bacterium]|nr:VOC family protein [Chthoniobacterales bacterium]